MTIGITSILPLVVTLGAASGQGLVGSQQASIQPVSVEVADQWNQSFTRRSGWTGADVCGSVDLKDGRILWLFGDTWIGQIADGKHVSGSTMVHNSIAISSRHGKDLHFHWQPAQNQGSPQAWICPSLTEPEEPTPAQRTGEGQAEPASKTWYWPTGSGLMLPGSKAEQRLVLFLFHVRRTPGKEGVWSFESAGSSIAVISNPSEPVREWDVRQVPIAHAVSAVQALRRDQRQLDWGNAAYLANTDNDQPVWLYVYGVRQTDQYDKELLVARVRPHRLEDMSAWEFYAGERRWSARVIDATPVANRMMTEFTVHRSRLGQRPLFVLIQSEAFFGHRILLRTAPRPEGPWSEPRAVYEVPDVRRNKAYFTYAAKGHPHLTPEDDQLLVSYLVNSHNFQAMVEDAEIYRPRFLNLRLKLTELPPDDRPLSIRSP